MPGQTRPNRPNDLPPPSPRRRRRRQQQKQKQKQKRKRKRKQRAEGRKKNNDSLVGGFHLGARLRRAELGDGAVEQVDLVVEVDHVDGQPLVLVLALGQLHHLAQAAAAQRRLGILPQLVARVAALAPAGAELVARTLVAPVRGEGGTQKKKGYCQSGRSLIRSRVVGEGGRGGEHCPPPVAVAGEEEKLRWVLREGHDIHGRDERGHLLLEAPQGTQLGLS